MMKTHPLPTYIFRRGEMDTEKTLVVTFSDDTDISVGVGLMPHGQPARLREIDDFNREWAMVTFCCCSAGGGKSLNTRRALFNLIRAIEKDNKSDIKNGLCVRGGVRP